MKPSDLLFDDISPTVAASSVFQLLRGVCLATLGATLLLATTACTTTEHVTEARPVTRNSSPSTMGELRIAETALDSGNIDLATSLFDKIVTADPKSVPGLTGLGDTLYAVGDFTRAGVYYQRASSFNPAAVAPLIGIARVAIHQRRFDDAISTYQGVLARTPDDPMASAGLGAPTYCSTSRAFLARRHRRARIWHSLMGCLEIPRPQPNSSEKRCRKRRYRTTCASMKSSVPSWRRRPPILPR